MVLDLLEAPDYFVCLSMLLTIHDIKLDRSRATPPTEGVGLSSTFLPGHAEHRFTRAQARMGPCVATPLQHMHLIPYL